MDEPNASAVVHKPDAHRYEMQVGGSLAFVDYTLSGNRMTITHTFVPPELRGRKIAAILVKAVLEDARRSRHSVVPQCSYVSVFMQRNPEWADLLAG